VAVSIVEVVDVVTVGDRLVTARGAVLMGVLGMRGVGQLALVPVSVVLAMDVTVVEVVPVAVVLDGRVLAAGPMGVVVIGMCAATAHRTLLARGSLPTVPPPGTGSGVERRRDGRLDPPPFRFG
jgi:hypothetical protein